MDKSRSYIMMLLLKYNFFSDSVFFILKYHLPWFWSEVLLGRRERIIQPNTLRMFCMRYFLLLQVVYQPVQLWVSTMLFTVKKNHTDWQTDKDVEEAQVVKNSCIRSKMGLSPNPERESQARHVLQGHPWSCRHTTPQRLTPHAMLEH